MEERFHDFPSAARSASSAMQCFTSTPLPTGAKCREASSDATSTTALDLSDICDRFQNTVFVDDMGRNDGSWKTNEMASRRTQLERIQSSILPNLNSAVGGLVGDGLISDAYPLLTSLGMVLALLEPPQINPAAITSVLALRSHRKLEKTKLLVSLKNQTTKLKAERDEIAATATEIRHEIKQTQNRVRNYEEEMASVDLNEVKLLTESYRVDIATDMEQFRRLQTMESICSSEKIDATMVEVKRLQKKAELLAEEMEYTKVLPPNLREIKILVEERKRYLQEVIHKVEDLMEFGYKT